MKEKRTYYFSVEGETEQWYLEWLQKTINAENSAAYLVKLDSKIQKNPMSRAKQMTIIGKTTIAHIVDVESNEHAHVQQFQETLKRMKDAQKAGKNIVYRLGYSNFTFELWMILHKYDCYSSYSYRDQYLAPLNRAYDEHFENLKQYKQESNYKRILSKLTLDDVRQAIKRSKAIIKQNNEHGHRLQRYCNYEYYSENPSLSVWECIEQILKDCKLL